MKQLLHETTVTVKIARRKSEDRGRLRGDSGETILGQRVQDAPRPREGMLPPVVGSTQRCLTNLQPVFADNGHNPLTGGVVMASEHDRSVFRRTAARPSQPGNAAEAREGLAARRVGRRSRRAGTHPRAAPEAAGARRAQAGRCAARHRARLRLRELGGDEAQDRLADARRPSSSSSARCTPATSSASATLLDDARRGARRGERAARPLRQPAGRTSEEEPAAARRAAGARRGPQSQERLVGRAGSACSNSAARPRRRRR